MSSQRDTEQGSVQDPLWKAFPGLLGSLSGLSALVIAIGAGWWADNDVSTVLVRALIAMFGCWIAGWAAGWVVQRAVHADSRSDCDEDSGVCEESDDSFQAEDSMAETQVQREAA